MEVECASYRMGGGITPPYQENKLNVENVEWSIGWGNRPPENFLS